MQVQGIDPRAAVDGTAPGRDTDRIAVAAGLDDLKVIKVIGADAGAIGRAGSGSVQGDGHGPADRVVIQRIAGAAAAVDGAAPQPADEGVAARAAVDVLDVGQAVGADVQPIGRAGRGQLEGQAAGLGVVIRQIDAAAAVDHIIAGAADEGVVARAADQSIQRQAAHQGVVALAAGHHFDVQQHVGAQAGGHGRAHTCAQSNRQIAGLGRIIQIIDAAAAVEGAAPAAADEGVIGGAADDRADVIERIGAGAGPGRRHHARALGEDQAGGLSMIVKDIDAAAAVQSSVPGSAADKGVVARAKLDDLDIIQAVGANPRPIGRARTRAIDQNRQGSRLSMVIDEVDAAAAVQSVVAGAADQGVVGSAADQSIRRQPAHQGVAGGAADDHIDVVKVIDADTRRDGCAAGGAAQVHRQSTGQGAVVQNIGAAAAIDGAAPQPADKAVVGRTAMDILDVIKRIGANPGPHGRPGPGAVQQNRQAAGLGMVIHQIDARTAVQGVVAGAAHQSVVATAADQGIAVVVADQGVAGTAAQHNLEIRQTIGAKPRTPSRPRQKINRQTAGLGVLIKHIDAGAAVDRAAPGTDADGVIAGPGHHDFEVIKRVGADAGAIGRAGIAGLQGDGEIIGVALVAKGVDPAATVQQIVAGAADQGVITGAAVKTVAVVVGDHGVVTAAGENDLEIGQGVGADARPRGRAMQQVHQNGAGLGAVIQLVDAAAAVKRFVGRAADEGIVAGTAQHDLDIGQSIGADPGAGRRSRGQIDGQAAGLSRIIDGIDARAAVQDVAAGAADQGIVAIAADQGVQRQSTDQDVAIVAAVDDLDIGQGLGRILQNGDAAAQIDRTGSAFLAEVDEIDAAAAVQREIRGAADEGVVAGSGQHHFHIDQGVAADVPARGGAMQHVDDQRSGVGAVIDQIAAAAAIQVIIAGAREEGVVARSAIKAVGSQAAAQDVVARAAKDDFDIGQAIGADA